MFDLNGDGLEEIPMIVEEKSNVYLKVFNLVASFQPIVKFETNPPSVGSITLSGSGRNTGTYKHGQSAPLDQDCLNCYTITANH